jgi:hypothetical protein
VIADEAGVPLAWRLVILHGYDHTPGPIIRAGFESYSAEL